MAITRLSIFQAAASDFAACPSLDNYVRARRALELLAQSDEAVQHAQCTHAECRFQNVAQRSKVAATAVVTAVDLAVTKWAPICPVCGRGYPDKGLKVGEVFKCPGCQYEYRMTEGGSLVGMP